MTATNRKPKRHVSLRVRKVLCSYYIYITKDAIAKLEMVQRRAARFESVNRFHPTASVSDMLSELHCDSLEERRKRNRLTLL